MEVSQSIRLHMSNDSNEKIQMKKKKKERLTSSLNEEHFHEIDETDFDEVEEVEMIDFERRQMKHAMRESRVFFFKKVDTGMRGVVLPHNLVVPVSSVARYEASA